MPNYEKMYGVLAEAVDMFFELLRREETEQAVELLMKVRLSCLECETAGVT